MERIVDLDAAAQQIESRRATWEVAGLTVGPLTWRDCSPSTRRLTADRATVSDPDSVSVTLDFGDWPAAVFVLFRGGWADVDVTNFQSGEAHSVDGRGITSPALFGALLDRVIQDVVSSVGTVEQWDPERRILGLDPRSRPRRGRRPAG
ncbi:hypothetical protein M8C13_27065 [Crossiella sp. SN42]|uniref:hypothetical protein n=1 Tax=Crossiella sp. SN42 TaxID=2944808 RepID=UPI00207D37F4|nr:hypothetical protein [Crossiella sp. SN42]MCO1579417.1 hypothetical protein [Crossiella sp. SN42]